MDEAVHVIFRNSVRDTFRALNVNILQGEVPLPY